MKAMNLLVVAVAAFAFMGSACGANNCEEAVERLSECGGLDATDVDVDQCDGRSECIASCINDNTCGNIISSDPASPYNQCVAGC
jgi:hypothetical protein